MAREKKLGLSPERTELPKSREETEFFKYGAREKNSVSPLRGRSCRKAEKRPSFSNTAREKKLGLSPERTELPKSREETEIFKYGARKKTRSLP
jgi:hypothetical protein